MQRLIILTASSWQQRREQSAESLHVIPEQSNLQLQPGVRSGLPHLDMLLQAEVFGNGSLLYGASNFTCVSGPTLPSKTSIVISPSVVSAGSTANIAVTPQVWPPDP